MGKVSQVLIVFQIVNGERASYSAPKFARMQERTRSQMLEDLVANLQNHAETGQIPKPYRSVKLKRFFFQIELENVLCFTVHCSLLIQNFELNIKTIISY